MDRGGKERHPGDDRRLRLGTVVRQQTRGREVPREVKQDPGDLGQRPVPDEQDRDLALGVDRQVGRVAILPPREGQRPRC